MTSNHLETLQSPAMTSATAGLNLSDSVYERLLRERIIFLGTQGDAKKPNIPNQYLTFNLPARVIGNQLSFPARL